MHVHAHVGHNFLMGCRVAFLAGVSQQVYSPQVLRSPAAKPPQAIAPQAICIAPQALENPSALQSGMCAQISLRYTRPATCIMSCFRAQPRPRMLAYKVAGFMASARQGCTHLSPQTTSLSHAALPLPELLTITNSVCGSHPLSP